MADAAELFGLNGKSALVLGGGLGMGESSVLCLAKAGADVAVVDVDGDRAERVASEVRALGRKAVAIAVDIFDPAQVDRVIAEAVQGLGRLHVMVAVPGGAHWGPYLDMLPDEWDLDHHRNLRYFTHYARAAAKLMVRQGEGGSIVAVASVDGLHGAPQHAAYGAAKAGLMHLCKSLAVELASHRIRVNAVAPGTILTTKMLGTPGADDYAERVRNSGIPFKQCGEPDDIGKAALFLASDLSRYVTGQTVIVDGGWTVAHMLYPND